MALEGGAEAQGLKVKMEDMNAAWDDIQNKSRQKQDMLEDGLREACNNTPDFSSLSCLQCIVQVSPPPPPHPRPPPTIIPVPSFGCERLSGAVKYISTADLCVDAFSDVHFLPCRFAVLRW